MPRGKNRLVAVLSSLELAIGCFILLMILVVACTLAQVKLGTHLAVEKYIRSFLVWWTPEGAGFRVPVFPGGGLVGAVLLANLAVAQFLRLERSWRKAGIWVIHLGLAILFIGEFATALFQVESRIPIEEGSTRDWSEDYRLMELAVADVTDPSFDDVRGIPDSRLGAGKELTGAGLPFKLVVRAYHENADLLTRRPSDPPSPATAGIGTGLFFHPAPPVTVDDAENTAAALVEPVAPDGRSYGVFLLSNALGAPQGFTHEGRTWRLSLRNRRYYLPFSLTLKDFRHDVYPGTDIPKNFSSLVVLDDPGTAEKRDVLISMNEPLRHGGRTFYQASFGKDDTLSVLQVVRNPGWTLPYLACLLVAAGLLWHFGAMLRRTIRSAA
ncbi:MAG: cytochrome c biogenesis protein ResB [Elusimicrobiota bacterium]|nr:MAG: cytochrome c biogenesis protein ResB [Elusimicrobiota bacterium]